MTTETFFIVKFDVGYYADKQDKRKWVLIDPDWVYTNDPCDARVYKSRQQAEKRGKMGLGLATKAPYTYIDVAGVTREILDLNVPKIVPKSYTIVEVQSTVVVKDKS